MLDHSAAWVTELARSLSPIVLTNNSLDLEQLCRDVVAATLPIDIEAQALRDATHEGRHTRHTTWTTSQAPHTSRPHTGTRRNLNGWNGVRRMIQARM